MSDTGNLTAYEFAEHVLELETRIRISRLAAIILSADRKQPSTETFRHIGCFSAEGRDVVGTMNFLDIVAK